jgi:hypothetical protein
LLSSKVEQPDKKQVRAAAQAIAFKE